MSAEDALRKLEQQVLNHGDVKTYLAAVDKLRTMLAMGQPGVIDELRKLAAPGVESALRPAIIEAFGKGRLDALSLVRNKDAEKATAKAKPSKDTRNAAAGLDARGQDALERARLLAAAGADDMTALAPVFAHANSIKQTVTSSIIGSGNEGTTAVADAADLPTVWIAETDACVDCLAYSGEVAGVGDDFPGGLTYGASSPFSDALEAPPLHPNCRCTVEPLQDQSFADTLRREADRSVLRGFSLPSESMARRIAAAERLLDKGVTAPKSVKQYAAKSIKDGKFPTRGRP